MRPRLIAAALALTASSAAAADHTVELELAAHQSGVGGRVEVLAGARLAMRSERAANGELTLRFAHAIESPWKLFHLDPAGPFGGQTKMATVITLPAGTWEALAEERAAHARLAVRRHAAWRPRARRKPKLDGSFAFVVIGRPEDRFNIELDGTGRVLRVENRMTDRWLGGAFDRFVGTWGTAPASPDEPRGYWFWNGGDEPFSWEPGTYRALAAALELLSDRPADGHAYFAGAHRVLEALGAGEGRGLAPVGAMPLAVAERRLAGGETEVEARSKNGAASVLRRTVTSGGAVTEDRLELTLERGRRSFRVKIGHRPIP